MVNETVIKISYDQIVSVTQHPLVVLTFIVIYLFVLICFILYGIFGRARDSQGRIVRGIRPIQKLSFWIIWFILWFLPIMLLILFIIFPSWIKLI